MSGTQFPYLVRCIYGPTRRFLKALVEREFPGLMLRMIVLLAVLIAGPIALEPSNSVGH